MQSYQFLRDAGVWEGAKNGQIPLDAVVMGREVDGEPLFAVRARLNGGLHPGKTRFTFGGRASIGFAGQEVFVEDFDILVAN